MGGAKGDGIDYMQFFFSGATLRSIYVGTRADFQELLHTISNNPSKFPSIVDKTFKFSEAAKAYDYMQSQAHFGKIVITVE